VEAKPSGDIEILIEVVHAVKAPTPRDFMKQPVLPVNHQIQHQHAKDYLYRQG